MGLLNKLVQASSMSDYFSEDSFIEEESEKKQTIRFCKECNNMLYPRDCAGKLGFFCIASGCNHYTVIDKPDCEIQNLVSYKNFSKEENNDICFEYIEDLTMQRDYDTPCDKCGHKESVFYMDDNIDQSQVLLMHICTAPNCYHHWQK